MLGSSRVAIVEPRACESLHTAWSSPAGRAL